LDSRFRSQACQGTSVEWPVTDKLASPECCERDKKRIAYRKIASSEALLIANRHFAAINSQFRKKQQLFIVVSVKGVADS
jgi:hypothetical protein